MAFAFVQAANAGVGSSGATTIPVTVSAIGNGNMVAAIVTWGSGTTSDLSSITDNGTGGTWVIKRRVADATNGQSAASAYGYGWSSGPTTITANFGTSLTFRGISRSEERRV